MTSPKLTGLGSIPMSSYVPGVETPRHTHEIIIAVQTPLPQKSRNWGRILGITTSLALFLSIFILVGINQWSSIKIPGVVLAGTGMVSSQAFWVFLYLITRTGDSACH